MNLQENDREDEVITNRSFMNRVNVIHSNEAQPLPLLEIPHDNDPFTIGIKSPIFSDGEQETPLMSPKGL